MVMEGSKSLEHCYKRLERKSRRLEVDKINSRSNFRIAAGDLRCWSAAEHV